MSTIDPLPQRLDPARESMNIESAVSAVSWPAILAGALAGSALSLLIAALGVGFGLEAFSPLDRTPDAVEGDGAGAAAVVALIVIHALTAGLGGYIAGRLRTKWAGLHSDEVFFRDTAHGFLSWATAAVITAALFTSAATGLVKGGAQVAAAAASGAAAAGVAQAGDSMNEGVAGDERGGALNEAVNSLMGTQGTALQDPNMRREAARILTNSVKTGQLTPEDKARLSQMLSAQAGIPPEEASRRVDDTIMQIRAVEEEARQAAETARKTAQGVAFGTAIAMLVSAFVASLAAAWGGKHRDQFS